jgi:isoleucyl-tRNA synthetase
VCSAALSLRAARGVRVRQPLASLTVAGRDSERLAAYGGLIQDEVNVKRVTLTPEIESYASFRLQVNSRALGPRLGRETQDVIAASKRGEWELAGGEVVVAGHRLSGEEYALLVDPKEGIACELLPDRTSIVVLDLELDDALVQEGRARDVVRVVQQARKEAGLHVSDRIRLLLSLPEGWREAVDRHRDYVSEQTLASDLDTGGIDGADGLSRHSATLGGETVQIALARAGSASDGG